MSIEAIRTLEYIFVNKSVHKMFKNSIRFFRKFCKSKEYSKIVRSYELYEKENLISDN